MFKSEFSSHWDDSYRFYSLFYSFGKFSYFKSAYLCVWNGFRSYELQMLVKAEKPFTRISVKDKIVFYLEHLEHNNVMSWDMHKCCTRSRNQCGSNLHSKMGSLHRNWFRYKVLFDFNHSSIQNQIVYLSSSYFSKLTTTNVLITNKQSRVQLFMN